MPQHDCVIRLHIPVGLLRLDIRRGVGGHPPFPPAKAAPLHSVSHLLSPRAPYPALLLLLLLPLLLLACSGDGASQASQNGASGEVKKITFIAGFKAQANLPFVGAYVAQEKGY